MDNNLTDQLQQVLQTQFKFNQFRPGQLEALTVLIQQGRMLCIQPTGHGKSLLYQLPAVLLKGLTLVISPLLALMRDQVTQLNNRFGISAASINTDQSDEENHIARKKVIAGSIKILFIAPEQLDHIDRFDFLLRLPIDLLVVDEAHCISTWGHDFRPSYRQIIKLVHVLVEKNPAIKLLALTATANAKTEEDIKKQLTVDTKKFIVQRETMDRPNIRLTVIPTTGVANKLATLIHLLNLMTGSGIVYCSTRENTELVAEFLREKNINAAAYHAGIEMQHKRCLQNDFLQDKYTVIVATNALGMGIDKLNLRYIIHFDHPGSITAYYQEVGRCGRDGLPAEGILLFDPADSKIQKHFIESAQPILADFQHVLLIMKESTVLLNLSTLKRLTGMHPTKLTVILAELIEQQFVIKKIINRSQVYQLTHQSGIPNLDRYKDQFAQRNAELKAIQHFAEQKKDCLMLTLRMALGDKLGKACGQCSYCCETSFQVAQNKSLMITISSWLNRRTVSITLTKKIHSLAVGIAVLDGKLRSKDFISFMQERAKSSLTQLGISDDLMQLMKECLNDLVKHYRFSCIIPIPSRTWGARDTIVSLLANYLKVNAMPMALSWQDTPLARQGELLNNDQRQHNVAQRMRVSLNKNIPKGTILLFDDYTGSGATLNEAARALREQAQIQNEIVPFTIAAVKWRLGKKGMI